MAALVSKFSKGTAVVRKPTASVKAPSAPVARAPTAAAAPPVAPPPPDASYEATLAGLASRRDSTIASLGQQRQQGLLSYGYTEDPAGAIAFDPTNPYSQAAILKRNYDQSRAGNTIGFAARGQQYSGALQNAQDYSNSQQNQASDALQKQLGAFLARNTQQRTGAGVDFELGAGQAQGDALLRAPSNPAYSTVTATAASPPATAATSATDPVVSVITAKGGVINVHKSGKRVFVRR